MEITLHRQSGFLGNALGRALPLSIFFDGKKIGFVKTGEAKMVSLPRREGILRVGITKADEGLELPYSSGRHDISGCFTSSLEFQISPADDGKQFELGTNLWVVFDVISLYCIPFFGRRVFYIRERQSQPFDR